ncbi:gamma-glutamyl-gamma-aminobutyrate hydrolase family protein [Wolbachia endosymbiont of Litomosoides brasiliensis]|uniref:glutamine amidotransferase n=1 Tax=Wolbachia endosymbiont of Litomosoides brasiliensis TaxID=1812117 RepID=UPI00158E9D9D|nr:glutamine amidotransferase [Wolbachia endosymbiont of Litomosoides brasiliensis]
MCQYYNMIFNILLTIVLLLSNIIYANASESAYQADSDIVVGLLKIEKETYQHELGLFQSLYKMFNNFGAKTVLIDYNKIINLEKNQEELLLSLTKQEDMVAKKLMLDQIKIEVGQFIKEYKINRILILGNYYNLHSEPFPPTPYRQLAIEAIMKIVDDNPTIHLLGVCGGLQGIMSAKGIEVVHVENLVSNEEQKRSYLKPIPNPQQEGVPLQQIKIVPNSRLAEVVAKFLLPDENGWFSAYFPDAHSAVVSNTPENRRKLGLLGYKIAAFSNDGIIEAIEDKYGNIYFQSHPEALIVKSDKILHLSNYKARQVSILVAIAIINDFLYRA